MASDRHRSEDAAVAGHSFFTSICLSHFKTNNSVRNCLGDEARNCQGGAFVTRSFEKLLKDAPGRRYAHLHLALKAYLVVVLKGKGLEIEAFHVMAVRVCAFGYF
jgi:hypothetical protein